MRNNATFDAFSVGAGLFSSGPTSDNPRPYSLIVGQDLNWGSGALYPSSEGMYVGRAFTGPAYLASYITGGPCPSPVNCFFLMTVSLLKDFINKYFRVV